MAWGVRRAVDYAAACVEFSAGSTPSRSWAADIEPDAFPFEEYGTPAQKADHIDTGGLLHKLLAYGTVHDYCASVGGSIRQLRKESP